MRQAHHPLPYRHIRQDPVPVAPGDFVQVEGEYIPASTTNAHDKNGPAAVIHYTHDPCGFVVIAGTTYRYLPLASPGRPALVTKAARVQDRAMSGDSSLDRDPTPRPLSLGAHLSLVVAWLAFVGLFLLPLCVLALGLWLGGLLFGASISLLHAGSFIASTETFATAHAIALFSALAGILRLLWTYRPGAPAPDKDTFALLAPRSFFTAYALGVLLLGRLAAGSLPGVSTGITLAFLYLLLGIGGLWVLRGAFRLARGTYRFAAASAYRAGMLTLLLFLISLPGLFGFFLQRPGLSAAPADLGQEFADATAAPNGDELRWLLFDMAESVSPRKALRQDARRFLRPLLSRVSGLARAPAPRLFGVAWAGEDEDGPSPVQQRFDACWKALYPDKVGDVERQLRRMRRVARDEIHDATMSALIDICTAHVASAEGYRDLNGVLFIAAKRRVMTLAKRGGRFQSWDDLSDIAASCPTSWDAFDDRVMKELDLATLQWRGLDDEERALIAAHVFLDMEFSEIAASHPDLSTGRARQRYDYAIKKIRTKFGGNCLKEVYRGNRGFDE